MSETPTFLTGTELLLQELTVERAKVALLEKTNDECATEFGRVLKELIEERDRAEAAESKAARLRAALEEAPHAESCASHGLRYASQIEQYCDCFKRVLKGEPK